MKPFICGELSASRAVSDSFQSDPQFARFAQLSITRFCTLDWGECTPEEKQRNDENAMSGNGPVRAFYLKTDYPVLGMYIITSPARGMTHIYMAEEAMARKMCGGQIVKEVQA